MKPRVPHPTPTPNPLKDASLIQRAAELAARELVERRRPFTGAQWSRKVIEKLGYGRAFAVSDQGTRTRLHKKEVKAAAFRAAGVAEDWLKTHNVPPGPAVAVELPPLPSGGAPSSPSVPSAAELQARLAAVEMADLASRGVLRIPRLLTPQQAREVLLALAEPGACETKEQVLRASTGNGEGGGYRTIAREPPALSAAKEALGAWLRPAPRASKCLLLRYGVGGVNWAHQDQSESPYQAVLLLNPATEFDGGALYVRDAAAPGLPPVEAPFGGEGDVVVFAANSGAPGGRHWYHGMSEVTRGRRFAVGLFQ